MIHTLITRLPEDGLVFAEQLNKIKVLTSLIPLQKVNFLPVLTPVDHIQALVFTSKNGIRSFCQVYSQRDFLVYCVGNATSELAKKSGFKRVYSAEGNTHNLVDMLRDRANPSGKMLLHVAGKDVRHSLEGLLPNYPIEQIIGYEIVDRLELTEGELQELTNSEITHVCLFSPKSAERFVKVLKKYKCEDTCKNRICVAFSQDVADITQALSWKSTTVINTPSVDCMLEYFHDNT